MRATAPRRSVVSAADVWQMDNVRWMLAGDKAVDADTVEMVAFWDSTQQIHNFAQTVTALKRPAMKQDDMFCEVVEVQQKLEAHGYLV